MGGVRPRQAHERRGSILQRIIKLLQVSMQKQKCPLAGLRAAMGAYFYIRGVKA